jgi:tetratricopeptide (TPR) repeat protein
LLLIDAALGELRTGDRAGYARRNAVPFAILAIVALGYLAARAAVVGGAGGPDRLDPSLEVLGGAGERVLTALQAWPVYARLLFVPVTLLADYGPRVLGPATAVDVGVAFGGLLLATTVIGGLVAFRASRRTAALALLWFPITILPVSNLLFPIGVLVAERTLYLPSVAVCFLAAAVATAVAGRAPHPRVLPIAAGALVLTLFAVRSAVRIPEWDSTDRIMAALVRDRPDAFRGQWHLARIAKAQGQDGEALALYGRAMELWPYRLGLVLETIGQATHVGDLAYADRLSSFAVERWPSNVDARRLLAAVRLDSGDTTAARLAVGDGLRVAPDDETLQRMARAIGVRTQLDTAR